MNLEDIEITDAQRRLCVFIYQYIGCVRSIAGRLEADLNLDTHGLALWRSAGVRPVGRFGLDNEYGYSFHGTGCTTELGESSVDFEFGANGNIGGFDLWRLWLFAKSGTSEFPEYRDKSSLGEGLASLLRLGFIEQPYRAEQDVLYYLDFEALERFKILSTAKH